MPFSLISNLATKRYAPFRKTLSKDLLSVEEVDSKVFKDTVQDSVGIYSFDNSKNEDDNITVDFLSGDTKQVKTLSDFKQFTEYEEGFVKLFTEKEHQKRVWGGGHDKVTKKSLAKQGITNEEKVNSLIEDCIVRNFNKVPKDAPAYLLLPQTAFEPKFILGIFGNIYTDYDEMLEYAKRVKSSNGFNILLFSSKKHAENCKAALQHNVLRFLLYKVKLPRIAGAIYDYIPAIDWADDRVKTDEGLLEVCGCPRNKAK